MIVESTPHLSPDAEQSAIETIVDRGPAGALALAGVAVAVVVALWFAFYLFVFLPRT